MNKEKEIKRVAEEICSGVNNQKTRKKKDYLEIDMLTNFGVLGLLTPRDIAEVFYNGFAFHAISDKKEKVSKKKRGWGRTYGYHAVRETGGKNE